MLNLLPKDYKNKVRQEYLRRFFIVSLIIFSLIDIFLIVAIFPSYILINSKKTITEKALQSLKESSKVKDRDAILADVKKLEDGLVLVATISGDRPTDYIDKAVLLKGKGISIQNISYTKKTDTEREVTLTGGASSRLNLIDFYKRVKESSWVTSSDLPLSNLASDKSISFFVSLIATSTPK
jgi:hypothetical protein